MREEVFVGYRQEAAIQGLLEIAVIRADRVVDGDQVGTRGKSSFYLHLGKRVDYWR